MNYLLATKIVWEFIELAICYWVNFNFLWNIWSIANKIFLNHPNGLSKSIVLSGYFTLCHCLKSRRSMNQHTAQTKTSKNMQIQDHIAKTISKHTKANITHSNTHTHTHTRIRIRVKEWHNNLLRYLRSTRPSRKL